MTSAITSTITPTVIAPDGFAVALMNSDSKGKVLKDVKGISDNGFQHLIAIKESTRKNLQDIQDSLNNGRKRAAGSSQAVLSEPLLQ